MKKPILAALAAVIALAGTMVFLTAPAHAESRTFTDTTSDVASESVDITNVKVDYTGKSITVRISLRDLPRVWDGDRKYEVWIDSSNTRTKPDFYMGAVSLELYAGRTRGWDMVPGRIPGTSFMDPFGGIPVRFTKSASGDSIALSIPARAAGHPGKIRVAVSTERWNQHVDDSIDHLGKRHQFTPWVTR